MNRLAVAGTVSVNTAGTQNQNSTRGGKVLIAYFSWGGNTKGAAEEIERQTGAELFEITLVNPYSGDYDPVLLGYSNWWASIPMPIASFLEEYDFSGRTIIPFCSHGGGRFGQSLTAIAKLASDAVMGDALDIHYSGGSSLASDVSAWLETNSIQTNQRRDESRTGNGCGKGGKHHPQQRGNSRNRAAASSFSLIHKLISWI
ncbi:hypothetical protein LQE92_09735 [Lacrimispora sp. NSJ-141]|uniref:Flavodoxin-like domain-containing protein n=1 Tax=Lientehia hominis TaxID=2897778 RepID=A0AAP2RJ40_9FIRM|nr:flavodoxin [Lientehia hominis]MCD2492907.1 hypothetical protein [Lientehia hominis]